MARNLNFPHSARLACRKHPKAYAVFTLLILLTACDSSQTKASESPWVADIKANWEHISSYQQEILKDYVVTDQELRDAKDKMVECISPYEIKYDPIWPYGYYGSMNPKYTPQEQDSLLSNCEREWLSEVEYYHAAMRRNPNKEDPDQVFIDCLVSKEVVEKSFPKAALLDVSHPEHPSPIIQKSADWVRCLANPMDDPDLREYAEGMVGN